MSENPALKKRLRLISIGFLLAMALIAVAFLPR
jgi:hypothetical protein